MSVQCGKPQTFQSSAALVKLTGVCDTFSDSTDDEEVQSPPPPVTGSPSHKNDDDSPSWVTTSWKSDSGFNSDVGYGVNLEQDDQESQVSDWHGGFSATATEQSQQPIMGSRGPVVSNTGKAQQENSNKASNHLTTFDGTRNQENTSTHSQTNNATMVENKKVFQFVAPVIKPFSHPGEVKSPLATPESSTTVRGNESSIFTFNENVDQVSIRDHNKRVDIQAENSLKGNQRVGASTFNGRVSDLIEKSPPRNNAILPQRTNPFNKVPLIDEGHFNVTTVQTVRSSENADKTFSMDSNSLSETFQDHDRSNPTGWKEAADDDAEMDDEFALWEQNVLDIITESLNVEEDYFSQPEGFFGYSRNEELEQAIQKYKEKVMSTPEDSTKRQGLVKKLVQLRLKLQELKDEPEVEDHENKKVLGHLFALTNNGKTQPSKCDVCANSMWSRLRPIYLCKECGFSCHLKCIDIVKRHCVAVKLARKAAYEMSICPEVGLAAQKYRCADCKIAISFKGDSGEPRQCDYTGLYYCQTCHWNDVQVIPARVVHNWDFSPRKICRQSKQLLDLMMNRVVINLSDLNPGLFNRVEALTNIKKLREDILVMKKYFISCKYAKEARLLRMLEDRPHFVEGSVHYTVRDLMETQEDLLFDSIKETHKRYSQHIRIECDLCRAKGFICELCRAEELIFPFDIIAIACSQCSAVFHRDCFFKKNGVCPKCERLAKQLAITGVSFDESSPT
ncbi:differentially expressed in FDCP 8-like [Apostichopus japonicus]|uniref:differentially expressed in FDCP 8-like n=1 Tax=Stichopus japonicus TaxID=307972 RepID=UPI003AB37A48